MFVALIILYLMGCVGAGVCIGMRIVDGEWPSWPSWPSLPPKEEPKQLTEGQQEEWKTRPLTLCEQCKEELGQVMVPITLISPDGPEDRFSHAEIHRLCHCEVCEEPVAEHPGQRPGSLTKAYFLGQIRFNRKKVRKSMQRDLYIG